MKRSLIALALATILPISAQAGELNYNYVQASYLDSDFVGESFDGYGVEGSFAFNENFYGSVSYRNVDNGEFDIGFDETALNLGWRRAMNDKADFIAEVGYVNVGVDVGSDSESADGYRVAAGFRGNFNPKFEGNIKVYYTNINDLGDGEFGGRVGGVFNINKTWGIVGSYDTTKLGGETIDTWGLGVRASF